LLWKEGGSALVETALTFPVFIAMLLGAVQLGQVAFASVEVTNAARAAAQYAAMNGGGFNDSAGVTVAAQKDVDNYLLQPTTLSASASPSCVCSGGSACTDSSGIYSCSSGKPVVTVTVTTSMTYNALIHLHTPGFSIGPTYTLNGYAQQEVLQ
jgi:Flp pilus assembly protein TadG